MAIMDPRVGRLRGPLHIVCACGYHVTWPAALAIKKLGAYTRPAYVRLRCSNCGARSRDGRIRWTGEMR